jgi:hypothetical protein
LTPFYPYLTILLRIILDLCQNLMGGESRILYYNVHNLIVDFSDIMYNSERHLYSDDEELIHDSWRPKGSKN